MKELTKSKTKLFFFRDRSGNFLEDDEIAKRLEKKGYEFVSSEAVYIAGYFKGERHSHVATVAIGYKI